MINSKNYNPNSYEAKRIKKELQNLKLDLNYINEVIKDTQLGLRKYLILKDENK